MGFQVCIPRKVHVMLKTQKISNAKKEPKQNEKKKIKFVVILACMKISQLVNRLVADFLDSSKVLNSISW